MMLMISPALSLIPIVMVPLSLFSAAGVMKASEKYYGEQQELLGKLNGYVEEMYNGQTIVQTFHYQERAKDVYKRQPISLLAQIYVSVCYLLWPYLHF